MTKQAPSHGAQIEFVMAQERPLWYRGYFSAAANHGHFKVVEQSDIELIRGRLGVERILVGHTTVPAVTALL